MKRLNELRQKRNELVTQARALVDKADAEKRGLSTDEQTQYDKLFADQDALRSQIEREEKLAEAERDLARKEGERQANDDDETRGKKDNKPKGDRRSQLLASDEYRDAFNTMLVSGYNGLTADQRQTVDQVRALAMDNNASGGFLVAPEQFVDAIIQGVDDEVFVRRYANVMRVNSAASLGVPTLDSDPSDADWTAEIATGNEDSAMAFGKREFVPSPLAKRIKISNKLIARSGSRAVNLVTSRLAYKFGITQEKGFFLGNGASQPLGVFTGHASGIPTSRDVSTGNTTTGISFDGLVNAKYSLKGQHQKKARWAFHRNGIAQIALLKDTTGQFLWQPAKKEGEPDMILGIPVDMSEYIPNTFTTGKYVGILANWKDGYWIADAMDMQLQVLRELYAETNQTGYIGRLETDGCPVLSEAFARVKLA